MGIQEVVEIKENVEKSNLYGVIVNLKERETDKVTYSRVFTFENQFRGYLRILKYVLSLIKTGEISKKTHYIEIKPTRIHKKPSWLFEKLREQVRVIDNNGFNF